MASAELHRAPVQVVCIADGLDVSVEHGENRRAHERLRASELQWLRGAGIKYASVCWTSRLAECCSKHRASSRPTQTSSWNCSDPKARSWFRRACCAAVRHHLARSSSIRVHARSIGRSLFPKLTARRGVRREFHIARPAAAPNVGWQKVIARCIDGRIVAGYTNDFHPTKQQLHLFPNPRQGESTFIPLTGLKALFFVREFSGDPTLIESKVFLIRRRGARSKSRSTTTRSWWDRHSVIAATATDSSCTRPTVDRTTCVYS